MAERKRTLADRLLGRNRDVDPADLSKLTQMVNEAHKPALDWDGKALASMSKIGQATQTSRGKSGSGTETTVSYQLLRDISLKSEVVNAILRRTVDDTLGNGYHFVLPDGQETGDAGQLNRLKEWFKSPNPDDNGNEWLETLIYDLALFGDAYLELDGSEDKNLDGKGVKWTYGGELVSVWPIPAEQMKLTAGNRRPAPPKMAYTQKLNGEERQFSADKVIHISKFKHGRAYGTSPLIALLNVIAGHLNLSGYLNELYTGTLPKTILNVGDISNAEMKAMLSLLEQQLTGGKSPFGLVAVNGGSGFNMHRVLDSTREGAQLDLLYYYREEICAVFGIPPMKLGWVQTGKMSNPEQQLDAWYDVIESFHRRVEAVINNRILPLLEVSDWEFKFLTIRPSRDKEIAETRSKEATAISNLRQEGVISVNEARAMLGLERLSEAEADDPFYLSPKLSINKGKVDAGGGEESPTTPPSLSELFPEKARPSDEGKGAGSIPDWVDEIPAAELSDDIRLNIQSRRTKNADEYDELISNNTTLLTQALNDEQEKFAKAVIAELNSMFSDGDEAVEIPDVDLDIPVKMYRRKDAISIDDIELAIGRIDTNIGDTIERQIIQAELLLTDAYGASLGITLAPTGIAANLMADDVAAIAFWRRRWVLPALRNTLGSHRENIIGVFENMVANGESWRWAKGEMRSLIDPNGTKYPEYYYSRIARTETRRVVENSHISGMRRAGFQYVERLVVVDDRTDRDLCAPYEGAKYRIEESKGVVPAHPNCRCTFVAVDPDDAPDPAEVVPAEDVLVPVIEFNKAVSDDIRSTLADKAKEHNEKVKNAKTKKTTTRTLVAVFERGRGAYDTNPQSVRPSVSSANQWAYARVNSFLYALRNGRFRSGKHDTDLLPKGHPQSTKAALESKRALTKKDLTPPAGVRKACQTGIKLFEDGYGGSGLEAATIREARSIARGTPITVAKAKKMIRWWGRNERFLDEDKDSPAWTAAMLWGGRAGLSWSNKLARALEAEE